jgi:Flp pilus assembly protein TadG
MRQRDAGSVTLEAVIIAPMIILLATLAVGLGRVATFHEAVHQAAQAAARAGSMSRTSAKATANATSTWDGLMGVDPASTTPNNNIHCTNSVRTATPKGFDQKPGSPDSIAVNNDSSTSMFIFQGQCTLESKWLLGLWGTDITVSDTVYSPLDPYRCRADSC